MHTYTESAACIFSIFHHWIILFRSVMTTLRSSYGLQNLCRGRENIFVMHRHRNVNSTDQIQDKNYQEEEYGKTVLERYYYVFIFA